MAGRARHLLRALGRGLWRLLRRYPSPGFARLFFLFALVEGLFLATIEIKHEFWLLDPVVLIFFARKILLDLAVLLAGSLILLLLWRRSARPAVAFVTFYFLLIFVDTGIYFFGNTLFVRHHLQFLTLYALKFFVGLPLLGAAALLVVAVLASRRALDGLRFGASWVPALRWAVLAMALFELNPNNYIYDFTKATARLDKYIFQFRNTQLEYATQNSLINFVNELLFKELERPVRVSHDRQALVPAMKKLDLNLGPRHYRSLGLKPFRRVVVITVESLTLQLIGAHNPSLRVDTTPFFLSTPEIAQQTFTRYWTSAQPTLSGLTTMFFSHPNFELPAELGYRNALPRLLKEQGFDTVFLRSASRFYANENIIFKSIGFDRIIAREDFYARPELRKYVYGWGLEDRLLFNELVDLLDKNRDRKIFVNVLGTDTHPPHGQERYLHLSYPKLPPDFKKAYGAQASRYLKAIYNFDYDLKNLIDRLRAKKLLDASTLIVITADHSCPYNPILRQIPGYPRSSVEPIPLIVLSGQELPQVSKDLLSSQLDFAPTLLHLLDLPVPVGYWGESLFSARKKALAISYDAKMLQVQKKSGRQVYNFNDPGKAPRDLFALFSTLLVEPDHAR